MYKPCFVEEAQCIEQLLSKHSYESGTETPELILFDELVEIHAQQLKDKTQVLAVNESVLEPQ